MAHSEDAELERTRREIAKLQAELGTTCCPEPESSDDDWSWVTYDKCTSDLRIGEGSGSKGVFKLTSPHTGEAFAVKVIDRTLEHCLEQKHHFQREVDIFNRLRHPGIIQLRRVISESAHHLLVVELCEGGELFDQVVNGALTEEAARRYFTQIVSAVDYCHRLQIYHRDLKLENVLVRADGTIKLADFGMAKDTSGLSIPKTKQVGTIAYMPPEVADTTGDGYDGSAADVWSLGVMLYVMAVCDYPFGHNGEGGDSTRTVLENIRRAQFAFPADGALSSDLRELICAMLQLDPKRRLSIGDVKAHRWLQVGAACEADHHPAEGTPLEIKWPGPELPPPPPAPPDFGDSFLIGQDSVESDLFGDAIQDDDDYIQ